MSWSWILTNGVAAIVLPPANGLLLAVLGLAVINRRPRCGRLLIGIGFCLVWVLSTGAVAQWLLTTLEERFAPLGADVLPVDAIVVLGGGRYRSAPESQGADQTGEASLARVRYAADLARRYNVPVLVTGGKPDGGSSSDAETMRKAMERDFRVGVRWVETASRTTAENAQLSAPILVAAGVRRIALVTHAWHMPRAVFAFHRADKTLVITPAPMGFATARPLSPLDFLPRAESLAASTRALHEWMGLAWYALRLGV